MPEYEITVLDRKTFEPRDPLIIDAETEELAVKQVDHDQFIVTGVRVCVPQPPPSPPAPEPPPDEWMQSFAWFVSFVGVICFFYTLAFVVSIGDSADGWSRANALMSGFITSLILVAIGAMLGWMGRTSRRVHQMTDVGESGREPQ